MTHFFRNRDNSTGSKSARTSADGRFRMLGLPTGTFAIRGSFNEKEIERRIHVEVEMVDGIRTEVEFAFVTTTNSVEGLLLNADNEPVMTYVSVTIDTGSYTEIRSTGAMGGYRFDSLPAGDVTILARINRQMSVRFYARASMKTSNCSWISCLMAWNSRFSDPVVKEFA